MRVPSLRRAPLPAPLWAALCGGLLGVVTFLVTAWMWRAGATHVAMLTAQAALLVALTCIAAFAILDGPARLRRARVPIDRALPHAWWPRDTESMSLLAAIAGAPLVIGAGAAVLLFR
jgi:hypothetical protein